MIHIQKLDKWKPVKFEEIPVFTFFEKELELYYKVPGVNEPLLLAANNYKGESWNAIRIKNGGTYFLPPDVIVVMVDVTINYKTTDKLST